MAAISSKEAYSQLIDPLTAPEPSAETGLNSHFVAPTESSASAPRTPSSPSTNPYRRSPPGSGQGHTRHRSEASRASGDHKYAHTSVHAVDKATTPPSYEAATGESSSGRRRGSSLTARYPGDDSHKPLDLIRKSSKRAHRSPHLRKDGIVGPDSIDRLDPTVSSIPYHHEGPYDAATLARNRGKLAPIAALKSSNAEALKATPPENVKDSLERHVPLDGTAMVPPGVEDRFGRTFEYRDGENLMIDGDPPGGAYKRYPGVKYHPDDIEGKGEPAYSQELNRRTNDMSLGKEHHGEIEMTNQPTEGHGSGRARSGSFKDGLKKRLGGLTHKHREESS